MYQFKFIKPNLTFSKLSAAYLHLKTQYVVPVIYLISKRIQIRHSLILFDEIYKKTMPFGWFSIDLEYLEQNDPSEILYLFYTKYLISLDLLFFENVMASFRSQTFGNVSRYIRVGNACEILQRVSFHFPYSRDRSIYSKAF